LPFPICHAKYDIPERLAIHLRSPEKDMELSRERFYGAGFRPGHSRHASSIVIT
jgi:hypothetical protein